MKKLSIITILFFVTFSVKAQNPVLVGEEELQLFQYKILEYDTTTFETTHTEVLTMQPYQGKKKKKNQGSDSKVFVVDMNGDPWVMYRYKETKTKPISLWESFKIFFN